MIYELTIREKVRKNILQSEEIERNIGFVFKIETWMLLSDYTQLAIVDWGSMEGESFLIKTYYCACKLWHLEKGLKVDFNEDDVKRWLEECMTMKQATELSDVMIKSRIGGESIEKLIPKYLEKEKKKLAGKKSKITPLV